MKISVLIPTYNEEENVIPLSVAIKEEFKKSLPEYEYEIVFIDNDSKDATRDKITELCGEDKNIKAIFNARNFGQFNSPFYGLMQTNGDCTILCCADFQDPIEMLPVLVKEWEKGNKIVYAVKKKSKENKFVRFLRTVYYKMIKRWSEVEQIEHFTGFGLYDKSFIDVLKTLEDPAPFLRGIVAELGYKKVEVPYEQQKRRAGKTSNNFKTLYDAAMLSFTTYTKFPIRFMMKFGIFVLVLSVLGGAACIVLHCLNLFNVLFPALCCVIGGFASIGFIFMSLLGEYILNVKTKVNYRPLVIEEKRINFDE